MKTPEERIAELVEQARRRRERDTADRAQFAAARAAGLRRRHANKLAHLRRTVEPRPDPADPPHKDNSHGE